MGQVLDLENPSFSQTFYQAEAVSCVLINDRQEELYPVISAHIANLKFKQDWTGNERLEG